MHLIVFENLSIIFLLGQFMNRNSYSVMFLCPANEMGDRGHSRSVNGVIGVNGITLVRKASLVMIRDFGTVCVICDFSNGCVVRLVMAKIAYMG